MTLQDAFETCKGPGKFEGENLATVYFYNAMLDGDGEDVGHGCTLFELSQTDVRILNLPTRVGGLATTHYVIQGSESGFITGYEANKEHAQGLIRAGADEPNE